MGEWALYHEAHGVYASRHVGHRLAIACAAAITILASSGIASTTPGSPTDKSVQWSELGRAAQAQYDGDGLSISSTDTGARLRCVFQRLNAQVSAQGLRLISTAPGNSHDRLSLRSASIGRTDSTMRLLERTGRVETGPDTVQWVRSSIAEEYSVSADGIRQDFLVQSRPSGSGDLLLELHLTGATSRSAPDGVHLILDSGARELKYSRLHVTDAAGRELNARISPTSGTRIIIAVDDTDAVYPVRIDPTFSDVNWMSMGGNSRCKLDG